MGLVRDRMALNFDRNIYGAAEERLSHEEHLSDAWFQYRRDLITATDVPAIIGVARGGRTSFTVYWTKVEDIRTDATQEMERGRAMEPYVLNAALEEMGNPRSVCPGLLVRRDAPWQAASVDALVFSSLKDGGIREWVPLEIKTSAQWDEWGTESEKTLPPDYRAQVLWQIQVLGASHGYLAVLMPNHQVRVYLILPDESDSPWLVRKAEEFYLQHLIARVPPEVSGTATEVRILKRINSLRENTSVEIDPKLIQELRHIRSMIRDYEALKEGVEARIREAMGDAQYGCQDGGVLVERAKVARKGYTVEPVSYETLRLPRTKSEGGNSNEA